MQLSEFITNLYQVGKVTVVGEVSAFSDEDLRVAIVQLKQIHETDAMNQPGQAPVFNSDAAAWGAIFLYRAIQLAMLRNLGEEAVQKLLPAYPGTMTPETIFSVDLSLRHLPDLLNLSRGLAPKDPLVIRLHQVAYEWPFSSVGVPIDMSANIAPILAHPSLKAAYIDRIVATRDKFRLQHTAVRELVEGQMGEYAEAIWPGYEAEIEHLDIQAKEGEKDGKNEQ